MEQKYKQKPWISLPWIVLAALYAGILLGGLGMLETAVPARLVLAVSVLLCFAATVPVLLWLLARRAEREGRTRTELEQARQDVQLIRLQKKQEQLNALQNQINPHFLYNTLDTIRGLALESGAANVADIVATLSSMFKYSMDYAAFMVSLNEELDHLNSYLKIQHLRFPHKFVFSQQLDCTPQDLNLVQTPKLVLQPLVENVFSHGFKGIERGGIITLQLVATDRDFRIILRDNGVGMEDERVLALNRAFASSGTDAAGNDSESGRAGIALRNIHSRIQIYCGAAYGLCVASTPGFGTEVTLTLPLPQNREGRP